MAKTCNRCGKGLVNKEVYYCEECRQVVRQEYLLKEKSSESTESILHPDTHEEKTNLTTITILLLIFQLFLAPFIMTPLLDRLYDLSISLSGKIDNMNSFIDFVDSYTVVFL